MPIRHAFILAAGKGTRMGEIGKHLPKVLWPLFDSTLLGLQIEMLKSFGVDDIAVNAHHLHKAVEDYLGANYRQVKLLFEAELLDAGGGVHNYLRHFGSEHSLYLMNSDQYLSLECGDLDELARKSHEARICLLAMNNPGGFSGLKTNNNRLIEIGSDNHPMYVGLSILNPQGLNLIDGKSKFFESVADYQSEVVNVHYSAGGYVDFGTTEHYAKTCWELFHRIRDEEKHRSFFVERGLLCLEKINFDDNSYDCDQVGVLNFTGKELRHTWPDGSIILQEGKANVDFRCVAWNDIFVKY